MEAGWVVTEVGRQPWIVYEVMRTSDAVTSAGGLWFAFGGAVVLYAAIGTVAVFALRRIARREEPGADIGAGGPYGPPRRRKAEGGGGEMSKPDVVAVILVAGATLYATFGGADFGAGVWELLAVRSRDQDLRERIEQRVTQSLGPVWEANHVWLIFTLVVLWTGFPGAFAAIMETLYLPLALAAVGIVLRGSGFAFGHTFGDAAARRANVVFSISSLITPFFLGCVVGAIAAGEVEAGGTGSALGWFGPLPILIGVLFVASCAYIAAVFLLDDCRRAGDGELEAYFLRRSIAAAVVTGLLAAVGLVVLRAEARAIFDGLLNEGLPFVIASALLGLLTLAGLLRRWSRALRPLAIGAVVAVVAGWAVAQYPYLLPETLTVDAGAGAGPALTALIVVFILALIIVGPALALLFRLAQRQALE